MAKMTWVENPKTKPPDPNKPYVPFLVDGQEKWFLLYGDENDPQLDLKPGDFAQ
jgi:hypothetical protein